MDATLNHDDPRVKRTRQLLKQAFVELMAEHGFNAVTVQGVAVRASVNRATFYTHFTDKYQLLDVLIREELHQQLDTKLAATAPLTIDNVRVLAQSIFDFRAHLYCRWAVNNKSLKALFITTMQEEVYTFVRCWIERTVPPQGASSSSTEVTAAFVSWAICGIGLQQQIASIAVDVQVEQVVTLLSDGMQLPLRGSTT